MKQFKAGHYYGFEEHLYRTHTSNFVSWGSLDVAKIFSCPFGQTPFLKEIYEE